MMNTQMQRQTLISDNGCEVVLYSHFLDAVASTRLFTQLAQQVDWRQQHIRLYGRSIPQPRLSAWYGDSGIRYTYSGLTLTAVGWLPCLQRLRDELAVCCETAFNAVLLNYYRDGNDSMGWHSDDEPELGPAPVIASLSLGAERRFQLKHKRQAQHGLDVTLPDGSLLLMRGATQKHWRHQLPKTRCRIAARINLTFRCIG